MPKSAPPEARAEVAALFKKHLRYDTLEGLALAAMMKHFTTQELDALAKFYGSAEGKSAMAKFGPYMADVLPTTAPDPSLEVKSKYRRRGIARPMERDLLAVRGPANRRSVRGFHLRFAVAPHLDP